MNFQLTCLHLSATLSIVRQLRSAAQVFSEQRENPLSMTTLLAKNTYRISTDDHQRELPEGGLFARVGNV
jgi:hypothetical protein